MTVSIIEAIFIVALPIGFVTSLFLFFYEIEKSLLAGDRSVEKSWEWLSEKDRLAKQCGTCIWWNGDKNRPSGILLKDCARCLNEDCNEHMNRMAYTEGKECVFYKSNRQEIADKKSVTNC